MLTLKFDSKSKFSFFIKNHYKTLGLKGNLNKTRVKSLFLKMPRYIKKYSL